MPTKVKSKRKSKTKSKTSKRCPKGTNRNPKTGRCIKSKAKSKRKSKTKSKRKSKTKSKTSKPCPEGKTRNPKTGRCIKSKTKRKSKTKSKRKTSKPCPEGKIRNPKTGRCINIKSKTKSKRKSPKRKSKTRSNGKAVLFASKNCPEGKIRNPKTGKCVNEKSIQKIQFSERDIQNITNNLAFASKRLYDEKALKQFLNEYGKRENVQIEILSIISSLVNTSLSVNDRINRITLLFSYINPIYYEELLTYSFVDALDIYKGPTKMIGDMIYNLIVKNGLTKIFSKDLVKRTLNNHFLDIIDGKIVKV
jgi:hypothetical protein